MSRDVEESNALKLNSDKPKSHALHVKEVPFEAWCRVRHNANRSRMTLRDYVIRLLTESEPFHTEALVNSK